MGVDPVSVATLRYWQKIGLLPLPERRRRGSGTVALYPNVVLDVLKRIRQLQHAGLNLKDIGPLVRSQVASWYQGNPLDLRVPILAAARKQGELSGIPVGHVEVALTDLAGTTITYTFFNPDALENE